MRYWFKECPRCKGDLRADADRYGSFIACVQCGYILNQMQEVRLLTIGTVKEHELAISGETWHGYRR